MNRITKLISLLLALVMVFSITAVQVFAATDDVDLSCFSEGTGYLAFGDSLTRGYMISVRTVNTGLSPRML